MKKSGKTTCAIPGCTKQWDTQDWCKAHYKRWLRFGDPNYTKYWGLLPKNQGDKILCSKCLQYLCSEDFQVTSLKSRHCWCLACKQASRYNISKQELTNLLALQENLCFICKVTPATHIDHDHACCGGNMTCGECIRAVLCASCNQGLGKFLDSPDMLRRAASYIEGKIRPSPGWRTDSILKQLG